MGANIGAKEIIRAEKVGIYGGSTAGIVSVFIGLTLALFPESWIQFFTNDPKAFEVTKQYIQLVSRTFLYFSGGRAIALFRFSRCQCHEMAYDSHNN